MTDNADKKEKARREKIENYVYTVLDSPPEDRADVEKFDRKRNAVHEELCKEYMDEPCFKKCDIQEIKNKLWHFSEWNENLVKSFTKYADRRDFIDFIYWHNQDVINEWHSCYGHEIETDYAMKDWIDIGIINLRNNTKKDIARCEKICDGFNKARDAYNEGKEYRSPGYCKKSFSHERNGAMSTINRIFADMEAFAKMPRECYLKETVKRHYTDEIDSLFKTIDKLKLNAYNCLMYWKNSKFWDPTFDW